MLVLLAPLSRAVLGSECLDADHSRAAINMPLGLDAVADHPATTVLAHRRHLVDPHSKLSNVCLAPVATTSNAVSCSFPQTSHVPISLPPVADRSFLRAPAARSEGPHRHVYECSSITSPSSTGCSRPTCCPSNPVVPHTRAYRSERARSLCTS